MKAFSRRRFRLVAWSIGNLNNWFSAIVARLWKRPLEEIRFRNGLRFKIDLGAGDLLSVYEVFGDRFYDRYFRDILSNGTILDIGGNVGMFTVRAARDLVPHGRVIAIEPNPRCLARIQEHLRMNHLDNVETLEAAVTNAGDRVALHVAPIRGDSTLFAGHGKSLHTINVPAIGTKEVLRLAEGFELVKVDCEGGEFALFYETEPEDWKNIQRVAVEYHIGFDRKYPVTPRQLKNRIEELGLTVLALEQMSEQFGYLIAVRP